MEIFIGFCLTLLELAFVLSGLLSLHALRRILGTAPLFIALGMLLIFAQFAGAAGLVLTLGYPGLDYPLSSSMLTLPFLAILIVVYMTDGTLTAQQIIIGMMTTLGCYVYLMIMTLTQCRWPGYSLTQGPGTETLAFLLSTSGRLMAATVVSLSVDLFLVPILVQRLNNLKCRLFLTVLGSLMLVQIVDHLIFVTIAYWGSSQWWGMLTSSYLTRAIFTTFISVLTSFYLSRCKLDHPGTTRRTLDIILAFFGAYGKTIQLEQHLRETRERYRLLVQHASDMIVITDAGGKILDVNFAALRMLGLKNSREILGKNFFEITALERNFLQNLDSSSDVSSHQGVHTELYLKDTDLLVDLSVVAVPFEKSSLLITFGRDITAQKKLLQEREQWNIQRMHNQRLEAIGRLAGGIAHDFNNYLHAIQGHLDIILLMHDIQDKDVLRNLQKIEHITEMAGTLTSQMLGFARKGNYQLQKVHLNALVDKCSELFLPGAQSGISFSIQHDKADPVVEGDLIQLQQVLMNLMINAHDAMRDLPDPRKVLTIRVGSQDLLGITLQPTGEAKYDPERDYCVIRVEDNGPGIPEENRERIFEPFFTTKPAGEGTGMGLAMAYGTAIAHKGWIQTENLPERGAVFDIVLPLISADKNNVNNEKASNQNV